MLEIDVNGHKPATEAHCKTTDANWDSYPAEVLEAQSYVSDAECSVYRLADAAMKLWLSIAMLVCKIRFAYRLCDLWLVSSL